MPKVNKENLVPAVQRALTSLGAGAHYLTDEKGYDIVTAGDYSLLLTRENDEIVVKDVYPGRIYARIKIDVEWVDANG